MKQNESLIFTNRIRTRGALGSNFVFKNLESANEWIKKELPLLREQYGEIEFELSDLPGLKIGDTCQVCGEGGEEFKIVGIKKYSPNRYGFLLDSGWYEEVAKCYIEDEC